MWGQQTKHPVRNGNVQNAVDGLQNYYVIYFRCYKCSVLDEFYSFKLLYGLDELDDWGDMFAGLDL